LRVWDKRAGRDLVPRCRLGGSNEAEWSGACGGVSPSRGWRSGGREVRFSLWLARVDWRGRRRLEALLRPARVLRRGVLAFAHPRVSSAFDLAPETVIRGDGIVLRGALAHRDGSRVPGSSLERSYSLDGEGLEVQERILSAGSARGLAYRVPRAARVLEQAPDRAIYHLP
jgi:hypothetical protein